MRTIVVLSLLCFAATASAADYVEYQRLTARANSLLEATQTASQEALPGLRESAVDADLAVIQWLDDYLQDPEFTGLSEDQQRAVRSDRYRWEYNLSVQLIALERCEEAADRLRTLVSGALEDEELSQALIGSYEEALVCQARLEAEAFCAVRFESATPSAQVRMDGALLGPAPFTADLPAGTYTVTFEAAGFIPQSVRFTTEGAAMTVGPVTLVAEAAAVTPGDGPEWYHWTLWGVGLVGVSTSVALYVAARDRDDILQRPPPGQEVTDPTAEREIIDRLDRAALATGVIGIASAAAGVLWYVLADDDDAPAISPAATGGLPGFAFTF